MSNIGALPGVMRSPAVEIIVLFVMGSGTSAMASGDFAFRMGDERLEVGVADDEAPNSAVDFAARAFEAVLAPALPFSPFALDASEPGFIAPAGSFAGGSRLSVRALQLQYWNGVGEVSFHDASDVVWGIESDLLTAELDGSLHRHALFGVDRSVPDGVYLAELEF
ncbi:MAG: hypothetical protein KDA61_04140, partial [Planctomycetales bacterium]|nr:hypothetical protein [Planctomycetales bacterium]